MKESSCKDIFKPLKSSHIKFNYSKKVKLKWMFIFSRLFFYTVKKKVLKKNTFSLVSRLVSIGITNLNIPRLGLGLCEEMIY